MPGPKLTDIRRFESIDSTNRYLLDAARRGAPEGVVAVAGHQTAGRGRLGRRWEAPPGSNLLASVLLRPDLGAEQRFLATAVVALAGADAAEQATGLHLELKWPNDLQWSDGRKVAGVLAEADLSGTAPPGGGGHDPIVVGIGMNVNWPSGPADLPPDLVGVATSLAQLRGERVDLETVLAAWLGALEPRLAALDQPDGRASQVAELGARCATVGAEVRVELVDGSFEGTATGLTPAGHLVVDTGTEVRQVTVADVVHLRRRS